VLIGHYGDPGVRAVPLVARESDPKIVNAKEKAIALALKVKLKNVKLANVLLGVTGVHGNHVPFHVVEDTKFAIVNVKE